MTERYQARLRAGREADILLVAEDHLATKGCPRFSVDEIAVELIIARATVYRHFPHRTALLQRVVEAATARARSHLEDRLRSRADADGLAGLADYARTTIELAEHHLATTGRRQLSYPCCLAYAECPFQAQDPLRPLIAAALEQARSDGRLSGTWWDSTALAGLIRTILADLFRRAHTVPASQLSAEIELGTQVLRRVLNSQPATGP